jgi:hypothetical protein
MAINGTPAMSWGDFLNIPDGTQVLNHGWSECVALANLFNEGVLHGAFVVTPNALGWWFNQNVSAVHGFERIASSPQVGDIFIASAGLYDSTNGHIGVVVRAWNGTTFGTMEQNGGDRWVARYDRSMANVDGFLRPINQSALAAGSSPAVNTFGSHIAAEGADWTYWLSTTTRQAEIQTVLKAAGVYAGGIDGNLEKPESVTAIKLICGNHGFFDLRYLNGDMTKTLCDGILKFAYAEGGYRGRMDYQIDDDVWDTFSVAVVRMTPKPVVPVVVPPVVVAPVVEPEPVVVPEETPEPVVEPEPVIETIPEEKKVMTPEEVAAQKTQVAAMPAADLGAIIKSSKNRMIAYSIFALVSMIVTNASVAYAALETPFPAWLIVSVSVIGNLSVPFAALAVANAKSANTVN